MARKMITPHPSITGMAAGFSLVDDLNKGDVVGTLLGGNLSSAVNLLSSNSQAFHISTTPSLNLIQYRSSPLVSKTRP